MRTIFKILSYDTGIAHLGIAKAEYDITTGIYHVLHKSELNGDRALVKYKDQQTVFANRILQLEALREEIIKNTKFRPDFVVTENAFHRPGRTAAYTALIQAICVIELVIKDYLGLPLFKIPARSAKRLLTQYGAADKLTVQASVLSHKDIVIKDTKTSPIAEMSEHEFDAIGVGYAFAKDTLPGKLCTTF